MIVLFCITQNESDSGNILMLPHVKLFTESCLLGCDAVASGRLYRCFSLSCCLDHGRRVPTCHIPEDDSLHSYYSENLNSHFVKVEHFTFLSSCSILEFVSSIHCSGSLYLTVLLEELFFFSL